MESGEGKEECSFFRHGSRSPKILLNTEGCWIYNTTLNSETCSFTLSLHGWLYDRLHPPLASITSSWVQHVTPVGLQNKRWLPPSSSIFLLLCNTADCCFSLSIFLPISSFLSTCLWKVRNLMGLRSVTLLTVFVSVLLKGSLLYRFAQAPLKACH